MKSSSLIASRSWRVVADQVVVPLVGVEPALGHLLAHRRLRDVQTLRRVAEVELFRDGDEGTSGVGAQAFAA
jgi:hypothetical protein